MSFYARGATSQKRPKWLKELSTHRRSAIVRADSGDTRLNPGHYRVGDFEVRRLANRHWTVVGRDLKFETLDEARHWCHDRSHAKNI